MLYSLVAETSPELENNLKCLLERSQDYPIFKEDLQRLAILLKEIDKMKEKCAQPKSHKNEEKSMSIMRFILGVLVLGGAFELYANVKEDS